MLIDLNPATPGYQKARNELMWLNTEPFHVVLADKNIKNNKRFAADDKDIPECIRDETCWFEVNTDVNVDFFPHILAYEDTGYELYPGSGMTANVLDEGDAQKELDETIKEYKNEIELFYGFLKREAGKTGANSDLKRERILDVADINWKKATEIFLINKSNFLVLREEDINGRISFGTDQPVRDIKGGLLRNMIQRNKPYLALNKDLKTNNVRNYMSATK
jgi:hypothetical protein